MNGLALGFTFFQPNRNLSGDEEKYDALAWHEAALGETEKKMDEGIEKIVDWDIAKKNLRKKFEWRFKQRSFDCLC
mgnify:FL=1